VERNSSRVVMVLIGRVLVAVLTWRDIRQQPAQQVRGSKTFWRISSAVNTLGSAGYWLIGRPLLEVPTAVGTESERHGPMSGGPVGDASQRVAGLRECAGSPGCRNRSRGAAAAHRLAGGHDQANDGPVVLGGIAVLPGGRVRVLLTWMLHLPPSAVPLLSDVRFRRLAQRLARLT
jgi:hypothetical protein